MKRIFILSLLFPLSLMAMQEATQDKDAYCGIVTQLINSVPIAGGNDHLSPISENTLVYKKIIPTGSSAPLMEFVTSIDDLNPLQNSRLINTTAAQYSVYINEVEFLCSGCDARVEFTTTKSDKGAMPRVTTQRGVTLPLGDTFWHCISSGSLRGIHDIRFYRDNDSGLLKLSYSLNDGDIESISRREDLEKCPSRAVHLMISYLRMKKISAATGDAYILSEKQDIE